MKKKLFLISLLALSLIGTGTWFYYSRAKPLYCLLAFGPEGRTRVWVVWHGDKADLYRGGDLTGPSERMVCESGDWAANDLPGKWWRFSTSVIDAENDTAYAVEFVRGMASEDSKADRQFTVYARVRGEFTLVDGGGGLELAEDPEAAPVVPFGQLQIVPENAELRPQRLVRGKENDLRTWIGTFLGDKTTAGISLVLHHRGGVPDNAHPTVEITFPNATPGAPSISVRFVLDQRC